MADTISDVVRALENKADYQQVIELSRKAPLLFYLLQNDPLKILAALDTSVVSTERKLRAFYLDDPDKGATVSPEEFTPYPVPESSKRGRKSKSPQYQEANDDDIDQYFSH